MSIDKLSSYSHFELLKTFIPIAGLADIVGYYSTLCIPYSLQIPLLFLGMWASGAFLQEEKLSGKMVCSVDPASKFISANLSIRSGSPQKAPVGEDKLIQLASREQRTAHGKEHGPS